MFRKENINLTKVMKELVEKYVKYYKTDFKYDKETMLDTNYSTNEFYWMLRESGTWMLSPNSLFAKDSSANNTALYYRNEDILIFKLNINKRGKKYAYGDIKEIKRDDFMQMVLKNTKEPVGVKRIEIIKDKDPAKKNKKVTVDIFYNEKCSQSNEFECMLEKLNVCREAITASYVEKYYFKNEGGF